MPRSRRGVYRLEFLSEEGFPVYVAVSQDNRRIAERVRYPFEDAGTVIEALRALLDETDPVTSPA